MRLAVQQRVFPEIFDVIAVDLVVNSVMLEIVLQGNIYDVHD